MNLKVETIELKIRVKSGNLSITFYYLIFIITYTYAITLEFHKNVFFVTIQLCRFFTL